MSKRTSTTCREARQTAGDFGRIVDTIMACGQSHEKVVVDLYVFSRALRNLVSQEAVSCSDKTNEMFALLDRIREISTVVCAGEVRCAEDLGDIIERFRVVTRVSIAQYQAMTDVDRANQELTKVETLRFAAMQTPKWEQEKPLHDMAVAHAVTQRERVLLIARERTVELITAQKKYRMFKLNRQKHAWEQFANALRMMGTDGANILTEIATSLRQISCDCAA